MHELYYWIALRFVCGMGSVSYKKLIEHFGTPERILHADRKQLEEVEGINERLRTGILNFKPGQETDRELDLIEEKGVKVLTLNSPDYPGQLKNIYDPPPIIYVKGKVEEFDNSAIAVVGSRHASDYGRAVARSISRDLALQGVVIVSGMARGIDSCAHRAALSVSGKTVAVLGCGIDVVYPPENRKLYSEIAEKGAVISEYPLGTEPNSYNFPARNRIISGLSTGVLVVEAGIKSGSLITARYALEQGRDVYAVPGNIYSPGSMGTNSLIKSGAQPVDKASDIVETMQFKVNASISVNDEKIKSLSSQASLIYKLIDEEPVQIDEIIIKSGLSSSHVSSHLLDLELNGFIKQVPGKRFYRC